MSRRAARIKKFRRVHARFVKSFFKDNPFTHLMLNGSSSQFQPLGKGDNLYTSYDMIEELTYDTNRERT